jgi:hypothetical protein
VRAVAVVREVGVEVVHWDRVGADGFYGCGKVHESIPAIFFKKFRFIIFDDFFLYPLRNLF